MVKLFFLDNCTLAGILVNLSYVYHCAVLEKKEKVFSSLFGAFASWLNIKRHLHLFLGVVNYLQSPAMEGKHKTQIVMDLFFEHSTCLWL